MAAEVVIVGSGAAGLTAAITAAHAGLAATVLEATPFFGGTTAVSGGAVWIPVNHHQPKQDIRDSRALALTYFKKVLGELYDAERAEAYIDAAPAMLRFMEENTEVLFSMNLLPDYYPDAPGALKGRSLSPVDYDGRRLGKDLKRLRAPIPEMGLFGSMQLSFNDAYRLKFWNSSLANRLWAFSRFAAYGRDRLLRGRGAHLANGNALIGRLVKSARDRGVTLLTNARAHRLEIRHGRVAGVVYERNGEQQVIAASRGVVLATGGFGADEAMRRKYQPEAASGWSLQPEGSRGDGIRMGIAAKGSLNEGNAGNGIWVPASAFPRADGTLAIFPSFVMDRHCPGSIIIDAGTGKRFVDESFSYQHFGCAAYKHGVKRAWMISDANAVANYGIGMVKPRPFSPRRWVQKGYVHEAATLAELARKIGVDATTLEDTVARFNGYAVTGKDLDFQRGENAYSAYMGDPFHRPNPALGALRQAPFYALEIRTSNLSTLAGLNTNAKAQVLGPDGTPIPGLYAAGLDNNSVMRGYYLGGGASIGPAMTFGYVAARHIAAAGVDGE